MSQAPVSAIIPTFNRAKFLRQAIISVMSGTIVPAEIIVVDDGSQDDTAQTVAEFAPAVQYVHQANAGKSAALNRALSLVRQPLVWIMDDDDLARPEGLEKLLEALLSEPAAGFSCGSYEIFTDGEASERRPVLQPHPDAETFHLDQLLGCSVLQPAMLVRRSCYEAVGPFDTQLLRSQDYDMVLRLARRFPVARITEAVFDQRQHDAVRGPAVLQQQPTSSILLWQRYGEHIFRRIHAQYDLTEYLPPAERSAKAAEYRALVRRAGLMGRRGLWDLALADLKRARTLFPQALTEADAAIFKSALPPRTPSPIWIPQRELMKMVKSFPPAGRADLLAILRENHRLILRGYLRRVMQALSRRAKL